MAFLPLRSFGWPTWEFIASYGKTKEQRFRVPRGLSWIELRIISGRHMPISIMLRKWRLLSNKRYQNMYLNINILEACYKVARFILRPLCRTKHKRQRIKSPNLSEAIYRRYTVNRQRKLRPCLQDALESAEWVLEQTHSGVRDQRVEVTTSRYRRECNERRRISVFVWARARQLKPGPQ